ncbi:MAG TPA: ATP-binding protein [Myxococcota bacterium]|nr:ATP-binding protein [Myxococcota bacterium]
MGSTALIPLGFAVVAFQFGAVNAWLWRERRNEPSHLWLAVTAVGVGLVCAGDGMLYHASDLAEAQLCQRLQFASAALVIVGFLRFASSFLGVAQPIADAFGTAVALGGGLLAATSDAVFDGTLNYNVVPGLAGQSFAYAGLGPGGKLLFGAYGVLFVHVIGFFARHLGRVRDFRATILSALCVWGTCATNDMALTLGLYSGAKLTGLGYCAFLTAFSAILLRRFVRSTEAVEEQAETLQRLVEDRTEELRKKDLQLAHGQRLATVATLAASCAHEINNPAAYVTSSLNRLAELWKSERPDSNVEFDEILGECREGVERIRSTVGELLSLARESDGERAALDLVDVVQHALAVARNEARYRVEIAMALRPVPPVLGDARLLGQVALNLLLNAIRAAAAGGSREPRVAVETSCEDGWVRLLIRDNGPGIPEALRPHLFDPFAARREAPGGGGFGLAVSHQIVTSHRGRLALESGPGGTVASVELPRAGALEPTARTLE